MNTKIQLAFSIGFTGVLGACQSPSNFFVNAEQTSEQLTGQPPQVSMNAVLTSWGQHLILTGYQDFADSMAKLQAQADIFCQNPNIEANWESAKQSWREARYLWKKMETFAFGPYQASPDRIGSHIDFWPAREDNIVQHLENTEEAIDLAYLQKLGTSERGLPVIEYLLFEPQTIEAFTDSARRCEYLTTSIADTTHYANVFVQAWDPKQGAYLLELTDAGNSGTEFDDDRTALSQVVNRMSHTLENIRRDKLTKPLGEGEEGKTNPDAVESRFSHHSSKDILANLEMIDDLYFGRKPDAVLGLNDSPLLQQNPQHTKAFQLYLKQARGLLERMESGIGTAIIHSPQRVVELDESLRQLQIVIQVDIIQLLGLVAAFNDTDGD